MMALGILVIMLVTMTVISVTGLSLMYLIKNDKASRIIFYAMALWGMLIAAFTAASLPDNYIAERLLAWAVGFLCVAGILTYVRGSDGKAGMAARLLVTVSVAVGMIRLFLI